MIVQPGGNTLWWVLRSFALKYNPPKDGETVSVWPFGKWTIEGAICVRYLVCMLFIRCIRRDRKPQSVRSDPRLRVSLRRKVPVAQARSCALVDLQCSVLCALKFKTDKSQYAAYASLLAGVAVEGIGLRYTIVQYREIFVHGNGLDSSSSCLIELYATPA